MADSKAQGLGKRTIDTLVKITGVRLWSGKTGDPNDEKAQGVEMSEMVSSLIVTEGSSIDYKFLTPKGFALSVATTSRKGIVEKATSSEITTETSNKFLAADNQEEMRKWWAKASSGANELGRSKMWQEDGIGEGRTTPMTFKCTITFSTYKSDTTTKVYYPLPFAIPSGRYIKNFMINGIYSSSLATNILNNRYYNNIIGVNIHLNESSFQLVFTNDETGLYIQTSLAGSVSCVFDLFVILG